MMSSRSGATRFAVRGNIRLAYEVGGPADPDVPAVVLLHDLLADRRAFAAQRDALVGTYRVVLPDARGHGASATLANQRYTMSEMAADVLAILEHEGIARAHLVGHGMGGAAAFELAHRMPGAVVSLTLIEPALQAVLEAETDPATLAAFDEARASDRAAADAGYKDLADKALDIYLNRRWGEGWRERLPRPRLAAIRRHAGALAGSLSALNSYEVTREAVAAVSVPALVVHGEGVGLVERLVCARLGEWLSDGRVMEVPESAALEPFAGERGERLTSLLIAFLADTN